jgi:MraZ protein
VFIGEYRHTVDDKGRLAVPAKFRSQLETGAHVSRWIDGCLAIHTRGGWQHLQDLVSGLPITDARARIFQRQIFGGALDAEMDRQGRVLLPAYLRDEAGLAGEALVVGVNDHVEIWSPERWADYRKPMSDPQAFADAIAGLGI